MDNALTLTREPQDENGAGRAAGEGRTLGAEELQLTNAYWRAANYVSVGQIYLYDNPLLREPLTMAHVKPLVVSHWGTTPGQNFIYVHLNRVIKKYDLDMIYIAGPGHGGPAIVGNVYLEGTWTEVYPNVSQDEAGLKKLFKQFSFPGGISSHVAPTTPGSIHEGGELGYSLSHAFGAAFDNPDLIVACVIGDGEAETGPLATAWQSNKFLDPITDGAVLPILHLNGYKISNPTVLARIEPDELEQFIRGCGWTPYFVEGDDPATMHELMATVMERAIADIREVQASARAAKTPFRPRWPMIVLKSPKGWTGPKVVDGLQIEGTFRAHQVPLLVDTKHPEHLAQLESWMKSYKAEELFDESGRLIAELAELAPKGDRRMGANPHANGGILLHDLHMPDFRIHAVHVPSPGAVEGQDTLVLGEFFKDIAKLNEGNFRIFGPDETLSNLLGAVFDVTNRQWDAATVDAQRASVRGLAGRLPFDRAARAFQQLRGVHPHRRFNVQPARQMVEGHGGTAVAPEDRLAELSARVPRMAAGPQRLHPSGSRFPRPCDQQKGRHRSRLSAARCQLPVVDLRSLPAQPALCERRRRRKTRPTAVADDGRGGRALHAGTGHLAMGQQRPGW
jgi:xylulose-5-phosphate/fructose-6-phosphate phosphoketolase